MTDYLRSILYHDLAKVDFLYRTALDAPVLGEKEDNDKLFKAITYRHDCVHRNGRDKEGNRLTVFTKAYVQEIAVVMRSLVDRIERKISPLGRKTTALCYARKFTSDRLEARSAT